MLDVGGLQVRLFCTFFSLYPVLRESQNRHAASK